MALRILFEGTVAKHTESPEDNEDAYGIAAERGRLVLSDGASESFDARAWSRLLVDGALQTDLSSEMLADCIRRYEALHDPNQLSWSKAAAYERGSFATLLVAQDRPEQNAVSVLAVGDSLAAWTDGTELIASLPYNRAEQFRDNPTLLATRPDMNVPPDAATSWMLADWAYENHGFRFLLCMTDALGAWLLDHQEKGDAYALEQLARIRELVELQNLVEAERAAGRLKRDDTTLIVASVTHSS